MKLKKSWKLFSLIAASTIAVSTTVPLATTLSSCSDQNKQYTPFSYDEQNQTLNVNSFSLFGDNNILYGFQLIKMGNYPDKGIKNYNLKDALNMALEPIYGSNFISEAQNVTQASVTSDGYKLIIPVTDTSSIRTDNVEVNHPLKQIVIEFPKLNESDLKSIPSIYSSSRISFKGKTMQEVMELTSEDIIAGVGTNLIPKNALFAKSKPRIDGDNLQYFIFIPNVGLSVLNIDFSKIEVPTVMPSNIIASSNLDNNWYDIINWTPTLPQQISYKVLDNPTGLTSTNGKMFISSYEKALNGQSLLDQFNSIYYTQSSNNSRQVESSQINQETLITDFNYFIKNFIADAIKEWKGQNILNSNVYTGVDIVVTNNQFNGSVGIQFQNTSGRQQTIQLDYLSKPVVVNNNDVVSFVFDFKNSEIQPSLKENPKNKYQAYLLPQFNNVTVKVAINNQISEVASSTNFIRLFDYSLELQTLVSNVLEANNYLTEVDKIQQAYEQEFGKTKTPSEDFYLNAIRQDVRNKVNSVGQVILGLQNIALKWAENPTILEFLQSLSIEFNRIITAIGGSNEIANIISTIFSEQPIASFLYFNLQDIVNLIRSFATPSNAETINGIANMVEQIVIGNPSLQAMEEWLATFQSAYASLEQMWKNDANMAPLLPLFKHILDTISSNPSMVHFVFMNLNAIFTIGQNYNDPMIKGIAKGLQQYMNGLLEFSNKLNASSQTQRTGSNIENDPNDLTKYDNIRVMGPFIYPNSGEEGYKSLFTCLGTAINEFKPNDSTANTLIQIGDVLQKIVIGNKNTATDVQTITNAVKQIFNVQVTINKKTETKDLFSAFSSQVTVDETKNDNSLEFKIYFKNKITWSFTNIREIFNSIDLPTINVGKTKTQLDLNSFLNVGGLLFPNNILIDRNSYIALSYDVQDKNINPIIKNQKLNWEINSTINKSVNFSKNFLGTSLANKSSWGSILTPLLQTGVEIWIDSGAKGLPANLKPFASMIRNINIPRWIFLLINNIYSNTKTYSNNIVVESKSEDYFHNFNNNEAMQNVECVLNDVETSGNTKFLEFLSNEFTTNVKWQTSKATNINLIKTPTLQWTPSKEFNNQLTSYLQLGSAFTNLPKLVNYTTNLSGYKITLIDKIYTIYNFTINFSVPTLVKDLQGNYSVRDSISFQIKLSDPI